MRQQLVSWILTSVFLLIPAFVGAQWQTDGVPISTVANNPFTDPPVMVADGAGGCFIAWLDRRSGTHNDMYAQRLNAAGVPQWNTNGIAVCPIVSEHQYPKIVSDGADGAIVIWNDFRSGTSRDIYAQRLDGNGAPQWTADGVPICTAAENQWLSAAVSDGAGGAFIVWDDRRNGSHYDVYVQRVDASGVALWTSDGVALCTQPNDQRFPRVVFSAGGAIVAWGDERGAFPQFNDIYAQRVDASGAPQWTADGVALCSAPLGQSLAAIISDGAAGAIVGWVDNRSGFQDPFARRIDVNGVPQWANSGVLINFNSTDDINLFMTEDGAGGAIAAWTYRFDPTMTYDITVQRINGSGVAQWSEYGVPLCTAVGNRAAVSVTSDGAGGTIVAFTKANGFYSDVYAQRVNASGVAQWGADGAPICTAADFQLGPDIVSDGAGGAILGWCDRRPGDAFDVYAQHVTAAGDVPTAIDGHRIASLFVRDVYPNPFAGATTLEIEMAAPSSIRVAVFDVAGRRVRNMLLPASTSSQRVEFDGRDDSGKLLVSGVYFCRVEARGEMVTRKVVITR